MIPTDQDFPIRLAAFDWLAEQTDIHGDVLDRTLLVRGFEYHGQRIALMSPQGIFKPRQMDLPLTITTAPDGPYDDRLDEGKFLLYKYRGTDPQHRDNVGLRRLMEQSRPLIYFYGLVPSRYLPIWPVYIVGDRPDELTFEVAVEDLDAVRLTVDAPARVAEAGDDRRVYVTSTTRARLHQRSFRERVIEAYRESCSLCRLRHRELLDAAHIIPDREETGVPKISNGISLCKLHHSAFDTFMIGISPDYEVKIRDDILAEVDGPMLVHGLQGLHGQRIHLPSRKGDWPCRDSLTWRYERFVDR